MQRGMMPIIAAAHEETNSRRNPPPPAPLVLFLTISLFATVQFGTHSCFNPSAPSTEVDLIGEIIKGSWLSS